MSFTPEQQALVWRIGERIADEVEKVAAGRQSDCEAAAGDIYAILATAPSAEACEWPNGRTFGFHDDPGEHDPCYVIMPDGAMLPFNHHAAPGVDIARARFVQAACNAALASSTPESGDQPDEPPPFRLYDRVKWDGLHAVGSVMAMQLFDRGWKVWVHVAAYGSDHVRWASQLTFVSHAPTTPAEARSDNG